LRGRRQSPVVEALESRELLAVSLLKDINPGSASSNPQFLTDVSGTLYFSANDGTHGTELWKYDGTNTTLVADINPGTASSNP
jgi:trimeric autotransporter adhesin